MVFNWQLPWEYLFTTSRKSTGFIQKNHMINALAQCRKHWRGQFMPGFSTHTRVTILSEVFRGKLFANSQSYYSSAAAKIDFVIVRSFSWVVKTCRQMITTGKLSVRKLHLNKLYPNRFQTEGLTQCMSSLTANTQHWPVLGNASSTTFVFA